MRGVETLAENFFQRQLLPQVVHFLFALFFPLLLLRFFMKLLCSVLPSLSLSIPSSSWFLLIYLSSVFFRSFHILWGFIHYLRWPIFNPSKILASAPSPSCRLLQPTLMPPLEIALVFSHQRASPLSSPASLLLVAASRDSAWPSCVCPACGSHMLPRLCR